VETPSWASALDASIDSDADSLIAARRHLHAHPEPSGSEFETVAWLAARLNEAGVPSQAIPSRRGLIAGPGEETGRRLVAIRGDLDALFIQDLKEADRRSTVPGVMHACGHDAHATMVLGASRALWRCRDHLPALVTWRALFQPAEETGLGAIEMIEAGAVEGVRAIVALHVDPDRPVGKVGYRVGMLTAHCSDLEVTVRGVGGHAARPHQTTDPIAAASAFVASVYQMVPRAVDSREPVVVTFGSIHGGSSPNVIPDRVDLRGTVRTGGRPQAEAVEAAIRRIGRGLEVATGVTFEIRFERGVDVVVNDPDVTRTCVEAAASVLGAEHVEEIALPSMGGEDFGGYLAQVPGCMLRLGVASDERTRHPLHSPYFDIDDRALALGAKILARSVVLLSLGSS
jgi:amidohydrolase